ncbi:unnamed protein product [Durusdinium trenchii]|uniref:C3H1-type domain-containing protein n=2 Tax=Durusdinium trenchii TaxID=1381693 RepID=A0ABP0KD15_9DINO
MQVVSALTGGCLGDLPLAKQSGPSTPARPLCEFHLAGTCRRGSRCHNPHSDGRKGIPCQFAAAGQCREGTSCHFLHSASSQVETAGRGLGQPPPTQHAAASSGGPRAQFPAAQAQGQNDLEENELGQGCQAYAFDCEFVTVELKNEHGEMVQHKVPVSVGIVDRHLETMLYCRIRTPRGAVVVDDSFARNASNIESNWSLGMELNSITALVRQLVEPTKTGERAALVGWALANDMAALGFTKAAADLEAGRRKVSLDVNDSLVPYWSAHSITCHVVELQDFYRSRKWDNQVRLAEAFHCTFRRLLEAHDSVADAKMTMELFLHWEQSHARRPQIYGLSSEAPKSHPLLDHSMRKEVAEVAGLQQKGYRLEILEESHQDGDTFLLVKACAADPTQPDLKGWVSFSKGRSVFLKIQRPFALELYFYMVRFDGFSSTDRTIINEVILQVLRHRAETDFAGHPGDIKEQMGTDGHQGRPPASGPYYQLRFRQQHRRASFWKGVHDRIKAHRGNAVWDQGGAWSATFSVNDESVLKVQLVQPVQIIFKAQFWAEAR